MKKQYRDFISRNSLDDPNVSMAMCVEMTRLMVQVFPELQIARGIVWSEYNADNYKKYFKQYLHQWCVDPDGNIVDPTVSQYFLLGQLVYEEKDWTHAKSCIGCGQYHDGYAYCGNCEWSE